MERKPPKRLPIIRIIVSVVVVAWMLKSIYFWEHGYQQYSQLQSHNDRVAVQIDMVSQEIVSIKNEIKSWEPGRFNFDRALREELFMAKPDEKVIFYSSSMLT